MKKLFRIILPILIIGSAFLFMVGFKPGDPPEKHLAKVTDVRGKPVFVNSTPVAPYDVAFEIKIKVTKAGGFACPSVLDMANALVKHADKEGLPYDAIIMGSGKIDLAIRFK